MLQEDKYFQTLTQDELWQRYCGFLDLSIKEFMDIQKELLMDEIKLVADSTLGKKIMGGNKPKDVEEFRRIVPLTTYDDYEPYLSEQRDDALAVKPYFWCHSSGKGGRFKWIPQSTEAGARASMRILSSFILASANKKGDINIAPGLRFFGMLAPKPYVSGYFTDFLTKNFSFQAIPSAEQAKNMAFQDRAQKGFQVALKDGVDIITAMSSVLAKIGERFSNQTQSMKFSSSMLHPKIVLRFLLALLRAKREKRAILPKDLWAPLGITTMGTDTTIYKKEIEHYWGVEPLECYASAEMIVAALQAWNKKWITFLPDMVYLEFIPYEEHLKHQDDKDYHPATVLLSEVEEGQLYEVVITQFYGMPLLRYPMGDLVKVVALRDDEAGINLPQIIFQRRAGESINLGGLADLDEKIIWQAIANTGIKYEDWSACKEYDQNQSFLRLYLELNEERETTEIEKMIHEQLEKIDIDYRDINSYLGLQPVRVTSLSPKTFQHYMDEKVKEGADFARLKPSHINPPEATVRRLLELSEAIVKK
ncbi:MAG: GH3 auxin-responsive promoter family protein [Chloroflexota bacterium]